MSLKGPDSLDFNFLGKSFSLELYSKTCCPRISSFAGFTCHAITWSSPCRFLHFHKKTTSTLLAYKAVASSVLLQQSYPCSVVLLLNMPCVPVVRVNEKLSCKQFCMGICQMRFCKLFGMPIRSHLI